MQEPSFLILTALAAGPRHGYGIMGDVAQISDGRVKLRAGTLYAALDRLSADGLVEADREEVVDTVSPWRPGPGSATRRPSRHPGPDGDSPVVVVAVLGVDASQQQVPQLLQRDGTDRPRQVEATVAVGS